MNNSFTIKTPHFEGPLDLLLSLIEKRKLFINDISLSKVTDDYISHVKEFENYPIPDSAQFILVASTLLLIKSKSLLPNLSLSEEETANIEDLEERLKIYQRIKELSIHVKKRYGAKVMFEKSQNKTVTPVFSPDKEMTLGRMLTAIGDVLKSLPKKEVIQKAIVRKVISLEEMIENLTSRIQGALKMSFKDFSKHGQEINREEKVNIIVSFLAMLELVKQGIINVTQNNLFDDIEMETDDLGIPKYN